MPSDRARLFSLAFGPAFQMHQCWGEEKPGQDAFYAETYGCQKLTFLNNIVNFLRDDYEVWYRPYYLKPLFTPYDLWWWPQLPGIGSFCDPQALANCCWPHHRPGTN
jgi:hypothetical protein